MEVRELMNPSVVTIEPTSSASLAARAHQPAQCRLTSGLFQRRPAARNGDGPGYRPALHRRGGGPRAQTMVRDIMTRNCATVAPGDDCREATRLMSTQQVRRLPVVEKGKLVGVISLADLARSHRFDMEASQALCEISENIVVR